MKSCSYKIAAEQKARLTYDNILRLVDDPDVIDPIRFLREREIVHYQRFCEAIAITQQTCEDKCNFYAYNPAFDITDHSLITAFITDEGIQKR